MICKIIAMFKSLRNSSLTVDAKNAIQHESTGFCLQEIR